MNKLKRPIASKLNLTQQLAIILFVLGAVVLSRLYYVNNFAVALPYWDQWDAEGDGLLRPWIENRLRIRDLWAPHNEHRIFPTRVLSLLIFEITGEWNNLTEVRFNIVLAVAIPVLLVGILLRNSALNEMRWILLPVIVAQFALPFPFENLLVGFQSQFYFLLLFTLTSLILAAYRPENKSSMAGIIILCVLSVITMASGFLTAIAVMGIYFLNWYQRSQSSFHQTIMLCVLFAIAVTGYFLIPQIPANQIYRARNISQLINSLGYILSWPVIGHQFYTFLFWIPAIIVIPLLTFRKSMTRTDLLMAGCFIWSFSQSLAIAYGRGQELTLVSSRYTELFTPGLISNAWFVIRFTEVLNKYRFRWIFLVIFFGLFSYAHITRFSSDMHDIRKNHHYSVIQTRNVCLYLKTNNQSFLQQSQFEIPFPSAVRLRELLDNLTIRSILPEPMKSALESNKKGL